MDIPRASSGSEIVACAPLRARFAFFSVDSISDASECEDVFASALAELRALPSNEAGAP